MLGAHRDSLYGQAAVPKHSVAVKAKVQQREPAAELDDGEKQSVAELAQRVADSNLGAQLDGTELGLRYIVRRE